eukprot:c10975_g1_i2.p1 GENE.c10975_g1_i2~~c10975_g1_i2.p1  ORF type:complete len:257 (+),score=23.10 c10975_g1_i2:524-1294(+)
MKLAILSCVCTLTLGLSHCKLDPRTSAPLCNSTLIQERCVRPSVELLSNWCMWEETKTPVCCPSNASTCCSAPSTFSRFSLLIISSGVLCLCLVCCVVVFCQYRRFYSSPVRPQAPNPTTARSMVAAEFPSEAPNFVFPDLPPLKIPVAKECIVCFVDERSTVLPCGHSLLCQRCASLLLSLRRPCPNCRTYFSNFAVAQNQPTFRDLTVAIGGSDHTSVPIPPHTDSVPSLESDLEENDHEIHDTNQPSHLPDGE